MISDFLLVLLGMAVMKGIVEPIVSTQTQRFVFKYLPPILDSLDPVMPGYIAALSPEELEHFIRDNIFSFAPELSEKERQKLFEEFRAHYDPLFNCNKVGRQNDG